MGFHPAVYNAIQVRSDGRFALSLVSYLLRGWITDAGRNPCISLFIIYSAAWHKESMRCWSNRGKKTAWRAGLIMPVSQHNKTTVRIGWRLETLKAMLALVPLLHSLTNTSRAVECIYDLQDICKYRLIGIKEKDQKKKSISLSEWTFNCWVSGGHE